MLFLIFAGVFFALWFAMTRLVSNDDGPRHNVIRVFEIGIPLLVTIVLGVLWVYRPGTGAIDYYIAGALFAGASYIAIMRRTARDLPFLLGGMDEASSVFVYSFFATAGGFVLANMVFHFL